MCGWARPWAACAGDGDPRRVKRQRKALQCGHWVFRLVYRFDLELRDAMDPDQSLRVLVNDSEGELLGEDPERLAADDASKERGQALVEGLLSSGKYRDLGH